MSEAKALLAELSRRGLGPDDVKVILLTHGHPDHIGGIAKFPKAQVMALAAEVDVVEGRSSGGGPILRFRSPRPTGIRLSRTLQDGEVIPLGPYQVRVFAVPGHTPGCAAYAIGENLFLGDSANQGKDGRLKAGPWVFSHECGAEPEITGGTRAPPGRRHQHQDARLRPLRTLRTRGGAADGVCKARLSYRRSLSSSTHVFPVCIAPPCVPSYV